MSWAPNSDGAMAAPISSALEQLTRGWRGYVLIALIALCSGLMGAARVPVTDIDEARFAQATRQMVETGDYVRIRLQDAERNRKPIGIHWMQSASIYLTEPFSHQLNQIWRYRLPSILGLMLSSIAVLWAGTALFNARVGLVSAALFAVGLLAGIEGMLAKTDSIMTGFTTLAMAALAQLRAADPGRPRMLALVFWAAVGCGALIKGPVTPLVAGLTLAVLAIWEHKAAWMRPLAWWPGPLLAAAIVAPWLIAIGVVTDGRFYTDLLANELGPKIAGSDHAHGGVPGYYLLLLPFLIFPASYALPSAARLGWTAIRAPRNDEAQCAFRFLLAWALPTIAFFEILPAKLIHYTLPAYPAIALLCGAGLFAAEEKRWRTTHPAGLVLFGVAGAVIIALMATVATFMPGSLEAGARRAIATGLIGAVALAGAIAALIVWRRPAARAGVLIACALVFSFSLRERLVPEARGLFVSQEAVATLTRARLFPRADEPFWVVGYSQPSLVFLTRTSIRFASLEEAATLAHPGDGMMIEGRVLQEANAALIAHGLVFEAMDAPARGMAIGRGERMALFVGRVRQAASAAGADGQPPNP
ncbi:MAG: glycosyltransferase family 39 protein [Hyphomonadaceae bacterium]